jgi:hypothetical protein
VPEIKDEKRIPREGKLVVTRTRDGGKSFEVLSKGLPQSHAYDVVYRHALALDATGERLAYGSIAGGLWVSEDQGDSWACVTHTLPPVYGVRAPRPKAHKTRMPLATVTLRGGVFQAAGMSLA